jgi:hypothetical protein
VVQFTFTEMGADVVTFPAASYAFVVSVKLPLAADEVDRFWNAPPRAAGRSVPLRPRAP